MATNEATGPGALNTQVTTVNPEVVEAPVPPPTPTQPPGAQAVPPNLQPPAADTDFALAHPGTGAEGEVSIWEARYSLKNFVGRFVFRVVLTIGWIALAAYTWGGEPVSSGVRWLTIVAGVTLVLVWLFFAWRVFRARFARYYRLTTRRLFVSDGLFRRRRDQVELVRIGDVRTSQSSLLERWLSVGTVIVESSESKMPVTYLTGVDDPKIVMDLIWHHARVERDGGTVKVDHV